MKRILLLVLISCSAGLHGFAGVPTGIPVGVSAAASAASAAQTYSQSSEAVTGSTENQISSNMAQLQNLISNMENALCGPGGMNNCIGGIAGDYNRWKGFVNSKYDAIMKYSNEAAYHAATELCESHVNPYLSNYIIGKGSNANLSFIPALSNVVNKLTMVRGTVSSSGAITSPGLLQKMANSLTDFASIINPNEFSELSVGVNKAIDAYNASNKAFYACIKDKTAGIDCERENNQFICCLLAKKCDKEMNTYLNDLEKAFLAKTGLYEKLLIDQPYDQGMPGTKTINASLMKCVLPGKCAACKEPSQPIPNSCKNPSFIDSCDYTVPTYTIGDGSKTMDDYLKKYSALATHTHNFVVANNNELKQLKSRAVAIGKKLKDLSDEINSTMTRMKKLLTTCSTDEKNYVAEVEKIMETNAMIAGFVIGLATVEFGGLVAGPIIKGLLMVATMIPPIANCTINPAADLISQPTSLDIR